MLSNPVELYESVASPIVTFPVKVLLPANVCVPVETIPGVPAEAFALLATAAHSTELAEQADVATSTLTVLTDELKSAELATILPSTSEME